MTLADSVLPRRLARLARAFDKKPHYAGALRTAYRAQLLRFLARNFAQQSGASILHLRQQSLFQLLAEQVDRLPFFLCQHFCDDIQRGHLAMLRVTCLRGEDFERFCRLMGSYLMEGAA